MSLTFSKWTKKCNTQLPFKVQFFPVFAARIELWLSFSATNSILMAIMFNSSTQIVLCLVHNKETMYLFKCVSLESNQSFLSVDRSFSLT